MDERTRATKDRIHSDNIQVFNNWHDGDGFDLLSRHLHWLKRSEVMVKCSESCAARLIDRKCLSSNPCCEQGPFDTNKIKPRTQRKNKSFSTHFKKKASIFWRSVGSTPELKNRCEHCDREDAPLKAPND